MGGYWKLIESLNEMDTLLCLSACVYLPVQVGEKSSMIPRRIKWAPLEKPWAELVARYCVFVARKFVAISASSSQLLQSLLAMFNPGDVTRLCWADSSSAI
ncbi:hypothetical protein NECAME_00723 [Necator americanus]|uniref:Uncharacterized protein n=1 Tax=Necator americanus TaxID=51031 RepID=W2SXM1_NECAM|nr:hypothetical protein NECAME_00723 [Necator americanus]ETN73636.1 hypothetical protein NECAME_00723 [Necator americanus]